MHGPLMFHQSGGCCDGSAPMCYPAGEFKVGGQDVFLGEIEACKVYIGAAQFEYWRHTQLIIDVVPGRGAGFSLEAPEGVRFLTRSRVFTDEEAAGLARAASRRGARADAPGKALPGRPAKRTSHGVAAAESRRHVRPRRILIVDDDADLRSALVEQLALHPEFVVEQSPRARRRWRRSGGAPPDIMIMDVGLPDLDGREAVGNCGATASAARSSC